MAIPKVDRAALIQAVEKFDRTLRDSSDFSKWEQNKAQAWVLEHEGRRYPPKKILSMATDLPVGSFSGGPETNDYLAVRGFHVGRLRENTLSDVFKLILEKYRSFKATEEFAGKHEISELFTDARRLLNQTSAVSQRKHLHVVASYGKGNWATIPWISILDDRDTKSTQRGTYVVYLFREDGKGLYLKLAQGVTEVEKQYGSQQAPKILSDQANKIRIHCKGLDAKGFSLSGKSDLGASERLARLYEASTVAAKYYPVETIPNDDVLASDLANVLEAYDRYIADPSRHVPAVDEVPLALVGTARDVEQQIESIQQQISMNGSWASWWSFPIKEEAKARLKTPFNLYVYSGNRKLSARMRVDAYETSNGQNGIVSPWPEATPTNLRDIQKIGDKQSEVFKTWFKVGTIEALAPPVSIDLFQPYIGLSTPENILNQNTFGYVMDKLNMGGEETVIASTGAKEVALNMNIEWLQAQTGLRKDFLEELVAAILGSSRQIILAGPPGTSKTWLAKLLAQYVTRGRASRSRFVQFHPSYSYESFVEGIRPVTSGTGIAFELQAGIVVDTVNIIKKAGLENSKGEDYVIVIDEANRANLPRVLGELMFLFEYRNEPVRLQYSGEFKLPDNLKFIATMNTADRSIRSIDVALRRRFDVFELNPDPEILEYHYSNGRYALPGLVDGFRMLNESLSHHLDRHHTIGHAFLMRDRLDSEVLRQIWKRKIFPLIEEFFFDQPDMLNEFTIKNFWPAATDDC